MSRPPITYHTQQACELAGLPLESFKYYARQGLVPDVARDSRGQRLFRPADIEWLRTLDLLRRSGAGISQIQFYRDLVHRPHSRAQLTAQQEFWRQRVNAIRAQARALDQSLLQAKTQASHYQRQLQKFDRTTPSIATA